MKVSEVAGIWQACGVSVIPILANQTKRPAIKWSPYQVTIPTLGEVSEWWGNGKVYGLALICGAVSGNLEMVEVEGRAMDAESMTEVANRMDEEGAGYIWDRLNGPDGYSEMSPSGGLHLLYRISDHEVPGNTKIASSEDGLCLAETRGHGGYVIVAPTPGICHPSGESWDLINGRFGQLPLVTWEERNLLHRALNLALDKTPPPPPQPPAALPAIPLPSGFQSAAGLSPGDDFESQTDWAEILEPHGWTLESRRGSERHWTRPGKDRRSGASATTGHASDRDRLYVFSTSTPFPSQTSHTKLAAFTVLNHGGDYSAAAAELARRGFGERREVATLDSFTPTLDGEVATEDVSFTLDEVGTAQRLWGEVSGRYYWVHEEKGYRRWDGKTWVQDHDGHLTRDMIRLTERMMASADEYERKYGAKCRSKQKLTATMSLMSSMEGCTLRASDFDPQRHLLNLGNGILNLKTMEFLAHDARHLMTRMFGASYDPAARCDRFQEFMAQALPDEAMRTYVQRALGYSLLGDVDQRSVFWIHGPRGTGKSTLIDTMRSVFGDYGCTASAGTFRARGNDHGPSNDLHSLRGKRFVTTSETAESTSFDEDLLKRLSGRDQISSRALYQENQEWTPEAALWMATNHPPRFNSDDDAIWRRTKLIPFTTCFEGEGQVGDMARSVLAPEADGILNWLLAGLADFLAHGLGEPDEVRELAEEQRVQSDSVARFLEDKLADGILVLEPARRIRTSELYMMYSEWARQTGEKTLGNRRFNNRVQSNFSGLETLKSNGYPHWAGLGRQSGAGFLGTISPQQLQL